ncbi:MAG TPA: hypothetical protein DEB74_06020, partial [Lachnospiraceae bacterium]|nr:hypothetical protein [Lachnospiraceae bacterium]
CTVFIDSEYSGEKHKKGRADKLSKIERSVVVNAFTRRIKASGLVSGLYCSSHWFSHNLLPLEIDDGIIMWSAQYNKKYTGKAICNLWQYTDKYILPSGKRVDASIPYYPVIPRVGDFSIFGLQKQRLTDKRYFGKIVDFLKSNLENGDLLIPNRTFMNAVKQWLLWRAGCYGVFPAFMVVDGINGKKTDAAMNELSKANLSIGTYKELLRLLESFIESDNA